MHTLSRGTNFCANSHIANGSLKRETLMLSDLGIALLEDTNLSACSISFWAAVTCMLHYRHNACFEVGSSARG